MTTKKIQISTATNNQLNWLVAKCEGYENNTPTSIRLRGWHCYTTDPVQMWPIIERERIGHTYHDEWEVPNWGAWVNRGDDRTEVMGETSLVACARAYVLSKLGYEAKVPEELM